MPVPADRPRDRLSRETVDVPLLDAGGHVDADPDTPGELVVEIGHHAESEEQAMQLIDNHEYGNGTCIFTRDGEAARYFADRIRVAVPERAARAAACTLVSMPPCPNSPRLSPPPFTRKTTWPSATSLAPISSILDLSLVLQQ